MNPATLTPWSSGDTILNSPAVVLVPGTLMSDPTPSGSFHIGKYLGLIVWPIWATLSESNNKQENDPWQQLRLYALELMSA